MDSTGKPVQRDPPLHCSGPVQWARRAETVVAMRARGEKLHP